jgi:hypothetical protein
MTACISVTDGDWIASLEGSGIRDNVNFWRKDLTNNRIPPHQETQLRPPPAAGLAGLSKPLICR